MPHVDRMFFPSQLFQKHSLGNLGGVDDEYSTRVQVTGAIEYDIAAEKLSARTKLLASTMNWIENVILR